MESDRRQSTDHEDSIRKTRMATIIDICFNHEGYDS